MRPLPPHASPRLRASADASRVRTRWRAHWASCEGQGAAGREGRIRPWLQRSRHTEAICPREGTVLAEELGDTAVTAGLCLEQMPVNYRLPTPEGPCCSCNPPAST